MRASWSAFYLQFLNLCHRRSAEQLFAQMRARHPVLKEVTCIDSLLERQHNTTDPFVARHSVVRLLAIEAQGVGPSSDLAAVMLILVLWPGLDAVRHRLWRDWPDERNDLEEDLLGQAAISIRRVDLASVRWVAATLIMNTERVMRRAFLKRKTQRRNELSINENLNAAIVNGRVDEAVDAGKLHNRLVSVLGRDAGLFFRILVLGETQAEAARALGLSHDAARKRHQRAMTKLVTLQNNLSDLSHSDPPFGL